MDREMMKALEADGEKLRQLTGEDHGPHFYPADILAARSPAWRELLTGKPRIGTCDVCQAQNVELRLHVGFMGLETYHCGCSDRPTADRHE